MSRKSILFQILAITALIVVIALSPGVARAQPRIAPPGTYHFSFGPGLDITGVKQIRNDTSMLLGFFVAPEDQLRKKGAAVWNIQAHFGPGATATDHCHPASLLACVDPESGASLVHILADGSQSSVPPGQCIIENPFEKGTTFNPSESDDVYLNVFTVVPRYATEPGLEFLEFFINPPDSLYPGFSDPRWDKCK